MPVEAEVWVEATGGAAIVGEAAADVPQATALPQLLCEHRVLQRDTVVVSESLQQGGMRYGCLEAALG